MSESFQEMLEEKREAALYGGWLTKFAHVERLGSDEVEGILTGEVIVENKLDGANLTVAHDPTAGLIVASRNNVVSLGGIPDNGFNGAVEYVINHPGINSLVSAGYILRGEWLVKHSINYRKDVYRHLYVFDVQERVQSADGLSVGRYLHPDEFIPLLEQHGVKYIPIITRLVDPTMDDLLPLSQGTDEFGSEAKEGIVIKNYGGWRNKFGRLQWAKIVTPQFKEKNRLAFGAHRQDAPELQFVSESVTDELIHKTINKIRDEKGTVGVRDMAQILSRVWYDAFQENLWDFAKNNKNMGRPIKWAHADEVRGRITTVIEAIRAGKTLDEVVPMLEPILPLLDAETRVEGFNFREARRLSETKARDTALAVFNEIPTIHRPKEPIDPNAVS